MDINLRRFNHNSELENQRKLFVECFPETVDTTKITTDHYYWKFHQKEKENASSEYCATIDKDMVGYYAAIPYKYNSNLGVLKAGMVCDVMTGVKARGKGIFTKLGIYSTNELAKEGYDITTGYPIRKEVIPGHLKAGWTKNIELPLYGRFLRFDSFLKSKGLGFIAPLFNFLMSVYSVILSLFLPNDNSLTVEFKNQKAIESVEGLDSFFEEWGKQVAISLIKDVNFLKWRLGAPGTSYHIITLRKNNKLIGSLICRKVIREGVPCLGILDIAILKEYNKYAKYLINASVKIAKKEKLEMLLVMMSKFWQKKYKLFYNSFIKTPFKFYLIIKKLNKNLSEGFLKNENNWHVMWIDSDDL